MAQDRHSTGIPGLDVVLRGVLPGDNIVWQVDSIASYADFARPFAAFARAEGKKLVYFRFAGHPPLLDEAEGVETCRLDPMHGFERFIGAIHKVIERSGRGAYYVFDCLSELAADWYSDQMLGNFFMLTCPYLYDLETVTYFAVIRNRHSDRALDPISRTTQVLLEDLKHDGVHYVRPVKAHRRYSPTINMLHRRDGDAFTPVTSSAVLSEIYASAEWAGLGPGRTLGFWDRAFLEAERALEEKTAGRLSRADEVEQFRRLARMFISRHENMLRLAAKYLTLKEILDVGRRMIGTGLIGGKAAGMVIARAILKKTAPRFRQVLEEHDSFYIGSDVFYTFLVQNGIWRVREKQRDPGRFLEDADQARRRILAGSFPDYVLRQFEDMLDYFGQAPFIVRSSSLLEDNFGNSFAGKYESVFCANQGAKARRLEELLAAVRTVYASTMGERALRYRERKDLLEQDEQMALLVMRVSGAVHGRNYYPAVAGVGFSFNPYVWSANIDPRAGVARIVFGLGTRAVERSDDDYTRIVALNAPTRRPESDLSEVRRYSQRRVDYLDLEADELASGSFEALAPTSTDIPMALLTSADYAARGGRATGNDVGIVTFDGLLTETPFVEDLRAMLRILQEAYEHPVDIEFTCNFVSGADYKINLVQCRPLHVGGAASVDLAQPDVAPERCILRARGAVIGQSRIVALHRLVYVVPSAYGRLPVRDRYEVAGLIDRLNRLRRRGDDFNLMFLGPGRWGTSTPSLGIPVPFASINQASVVCEIVAMRDDLVPDVSLGTHFLNEMVEMDVLYLALFPGEKDSLLNEGFFLSAANRLPALLPGAERWRDVVVVVDADAPDAGRSRIVLHADARGQQAVCYFDAAQA
ncbi:MAG: pyruvate, phosphate dikinase [Lentisphaerae bacterium]|nr:pyruvate, phosphate dikinase [Lentisphaerota bacterium]